MNTGLTLRVSNMKYPMVSLFQVNQAILGLHGVDVQFIGLIFLESLVSLSLKENWFFVGR